MLNPNRRVSIFLMVLALTSLMFPIDIGEKVTISCYCLPWVSFCWVFCKSNLSTKFSCKKRFWL